MMLNKLDPRSYDDLRKDKLKVDIAWKLAQTAYINYKLGKPIPKTEDSEKAHYAPEEKSLNQLINTMWNKFVDTLKQEDRGWLVSCSLCHTGFPMLSSREAAIIRFKKHLLETHSEELVRVV